MTTKKKDDTPDDLGASEVQAIVDAENEQGFRGVAVDPTPNENYTLAGVAAGKPTPESDLEYGREVKAKLAERANDRTLRPETVEQ